MRRRRGRSQPTARAVALWRYEAIRPALLLPRGSARRRAIQRIARSRLTLPSGERTRVGRATLYRWVAAYEKGGGVSGLEPRRRSDRGKPRVRVPDVVVEKALDYLAADPDLTLPFLVHVLQNDPEVEAQLARVGVSSISRSTLQRRLSAHPLYARLRRARKRDRARRRWVPRRPHDVWHMDAKGPEKVRFLSGEEMVFHILSVLDGASRAVLAAIIVPSPDVRATVRAFRLAARRYGLPRLFYADRGSPFDTPVFRGGIAVLGSHRVNAKGGNPEANGKIEAYHRDLDLWFLKRLPKQKVVDAVHLDQLFTAVIEYYLDHPHREIRTSPRLALAGAASSRFVSQERLEEVFLEARTLKAHRRTGEVDLGGERGKWCVPAELRGERLEVLLDPDPEVTPRVREPATGRLLPLERAAVRPEHAAPEPAREPEPARWGHGILQALYDQWKGKVRPVAEPGFGLPEMLALLAEVSGRAVPRSDSEAALVQRAYAASGPLARRPTESALRAIQKELGPGRPLKTYLDALARRVVPGGAPVPTKKKRRRTKP